MKRILALLLMLTVVFVASAKSVVFTLNNGTLVYYLLGGEKNPVMRFVDGKFVVNTDEYEFSGVKNFFISNEDDPQQTAIADAKLTGTSFDGNMLFVAAKQGGVKVYDASGKERKVKVSKIDNGTCVDLSTLTKGTYVVKIGESSMKVSKK